MHKQQSNLMSYLFFFFFLSSSTVSLAKTGGNSDKPALTQNPFTAKASLIRYWNRQISNNLSKPQFLLSKASPLSSVDLATLIKLVDQHNLSSHLHSFCSSANLFCFSDSSPSLHKYDEDANFAVYSDKNFTNYGTSQPGGLDSFKNYSDGENIVVDSFGRYSRDSAGHDDKFTNYASDGNVVDGSFKNYGFGSSGGSGEFKNYHQNVNVPNLQFASYESDGNGRRQSFSSYTEQTNSGNEGFKSYGKNSNGVPTEFNSYGNGSNVMESSFSGYGESGNGANDSFKSYAFDSNNPQNNFRSYGDGGNAGMDEFSSYRDQANVGDDSFQSYAKKSNSAKVNFANYGKSLNMGTDTFKGYGNRGAMGQSIGFKNYGVNTTFKDYAEKGITFSEYTNSSSATMAGSGSSVNRWVEQGKFFRESKLKQGTVMRMPDIRDKMPKRSFLPRSISSKLPFSTSRISVLKEIFHAREDSTMEGVLEKTVKECERGPSLGETRRCVGSVEDMIDFAVSVLGHDVVVRSAENVEGSKEDVMIGEVKGINGGRVTESVSCHQSLFPYMVYYCHSVPKVRVYEADVLDVKSKEKINHVVAICHLDTSAWSQGNGAFVALGSGPGRIEVCHWIFENDMNWTTAD